MFEQKCRIKDISKSLSGECIITLTVPPSALGGCRDYMNKDLRVRLCEWKNKRSKDANAYFWELCGTLAAVIRRSPESIYRELIKDVGGNYAVLCLQSKAAETFIANWESRGIGWVCDTTDSKLAGCVNVIAYYGSSTYDTAQMSRLIDLIAEECKAQGIETATPEELSLIMEGPK